MEWTTPKPEFQRRACGKQVQKNKNALTSQLHFQDKRLRVMVRGLALVRPGLNVIAEFILRTSSEARACFEVHGFLSE